MEVPAPAGDGREGPPQRALVGAGDELSVLRGLRYIRDLGSSLLANPRTRERYGSDLLLPFFLTARVSPGAAPAERMALDVARHLALAWRATAAPASPAVVQAGSPRVLRDLAQGLYSLRMLGLPAPGLLAQLRERVAAVPAAEVLLFDPGRERAPHLQLFDPCSCGAYTHPRAPDCLCGHRLHARPRFDVLLDALVYAFHFERMALPAGVCYFEVLRQLCDEYARATSSIAAAAAAATTTPGAKPRAAATRARARLDSEVEEVDRQRDAHYLFYAVTHLVYTLNGFDQTHLGPGLLPATALGYLGAELECAMAADDPDRTAEAIVALRALLPLTPDALLPPDASAPNSLLPDSRGADSSAPADGPTARREERDQAGAGRAHDQPLADPSKSALGALQAQLGRGVAYLRRAQSADGGWAVAAAGGEGEELDLFSRYHAALVAVAALRETHYQIASRQVQQGAVGGQPAVPLSTDVVGGPPDAVSQPAGSVGGEPAPTRAEWSGVVFAGLRESASGGRAVLRAWLQPQGSCAQPHRSHHSSEEQARSPGAHANNGPLARDTGDTEAGRGNAECVECAGDTADTQQRAEASNTQRQRGCTCGIANPLALCRMRHAEAYHAARRASARSAQAALPAREAMPFPLPADLKTLVRRLPVLSRLPIRADELSRRRAERTLAEKERHRRKNTLWAAAEPDAPGIPDWTVAGPGNASRISSSPVGPLQLQRHSLHQSMPGGGGAFKPFPPRRPPALQGSRSSAALLPQVSLSGGSGPLRWASRHGAQPSSRQLSRSLTSGLPPPRLR